MEPLKTALYEKHLSLGAKMVEFAGFLMPVNYPGGIVEEHLATRKFSGLFDVSHMGRFVFSGRGKLSFLQHLLTNNAEALDVGQAQYTIIQNADGGAIDDAYLYRFTEDEYLLVVNAANRKKDWEHLSSFLGDFDEVQMNDESEQITMLSLQGPTSKSILKNIIDSGSLPEPVRNALSVATINDADVRIARTGYTGEPLCFELFVSTENCSMIWDLLLQKGATAVGLGARDTLRLEAGLPLYGHELGLDQDQKEIPVFSSPLSRFAVSFARSKGDFIGKPALEKQFRALRKINSGDYSDTGELPRLIMKAELLGKGIAREGCRVFSGEKAIGFVTSGTMVPYWKVEGEELESRLTDQKGMRAIFLALLDNNLREGDKIDVEIRGKNIEAVIVPRFLSRSASTFIRPFLAPRH